MSGERQKHLEDIRNYYIDTQAVYQKWGEYSDCPDLYSLHFGFFDIDQPIDREKNLQGLSALTREIISRSGIQNGTNILDAGCGTGTLSYEVRRQFPASRVTGVNISDIQLATAMNHNHRNSDSPYFVIGDYQQLPFASTFFDTVVFCESLIHSRDKAWTLKEAARVLKPAGRLLVADYLSCEGEKIDEDPLWGDLMQGWKIPGVISPQTMNGYLKNAGFGNFTITDVTARVLPSIRYLGEGARKKLDTETKMTREIEQNRLASIAFFQLINKRKCRYYFVEASRNS